MADYLNIAGRVRTTASDGVAMEAQEVKDLNQNKSQQDINADVQTELGDRYTKEETYSKEQLNELITTPDVNYVSVVATNATTAVTDLLPATGSSDTLYNVGNWNGTQYDTTVYSIYGWDGTAYVCLAVRSSIGEVYDISANHPDGQGNPTPYTDLAAALGTNGANIPAGIRRGGMSIKFIQGTAQSSDNKYIQARCMAQNFTTNVAYWQAIDDGSTELCSISGDISVGGYKRTYTIPSVNKDQYCEVVVGIVSGDALTSGTVEFCNDSWAVLESGTVNIGEVATLLLPAGCTKAMFVNANDTPVQSKTRVSLTIRIGGVQERLHTVETIAENNKTDIDGLKTTTDVVRTTENEGLTDVQKQNALTNIGIPTVREKTNDLPDGTSIINISSRINSGNSQRVATFSEISEDTYATLHFSGLNARVSFVNTEDYRKKAAYILNDGEIQFVKIPAGSNCAIVSTINETTVSANTSFTITAVKSSANCDINRQKGYFEGSEPFNILYNFAYKIAATEYRAYFFVPETNEDIQSSVVLSGLDGYVSFANASYFALAKYSTQDGVRKNIIIPKGTSLVYVIAENDEPVSEDTYFTLRVISGNISSLEPDKKMLYFNRKKISNGEYRDTSVRVSPLERPVVGKITLQGFNGSVEFNTERWNVKASYNLTNGIEQEITIPSGCPYIIVYIEPREAVSEDTPYFLSITYSEKEYQREVQIQNHEDDKRYIPVLESMKRTCLGSNGHPLETYKTLTFASITDIHNQKDAANRIFKFIHKYGNYFDDVIGLGDYYASSLNDRLPFVLDQIEGWDEVIKALGNHDAYTRWPLEGESSDIATEQDCYNAVYANDISKWGVEYTANKCYFYKDYDDANIRVVYVDYMHYDSTQETWLRNVLYDGGSNSAATKGYHVVICVHSVPESITSGAPVPFENCTFEYYDRAQIRDNNCNITEIVNEFQTTYHGKFVAYLCGHWHTCFTGVFENYPNQLVIVQPCSANFDSWRDTVFPWESDYILQFYLYSFDSYKQFVRVYKVGANYNRNLQHQESMLIQYGDTVKLLSCY